METIFTRKHIITVDVVFFKVLYVNIEVLLGIFRNHSSLFSPGTEFGLGYFYLAEFILFFKLDLQPNT